MTTDEQHPLGAGAPRWSPDSTRLAYSARVPEQGRYGTEDGRGPEKEPPRRITDAALPSGRRRLPHRPAAARLRARPVRARAGAGPGDRRAGEDTDVTWTPDGGLLFGSDRDAPWNTNLHWDVYACAADGSDLRRLTPGGQDAGVPAASADGRTVFYLAVSDLGPDRMDFVGRNGALWSVPADGWAAPTRLTEPASDLVPVGDRCWSTGPACSPAPAAAAARSWCRVPATGGEPEVVPVGARTVLGARPPAGRSWSPRRTHSSAGEVFVVGRDESLTDFGAELAARAPAAAAAGADRDRPGRLPGARLAGATPPATARTRCC